jgi:uncharacterized protein
MKKTWYGDGLRFQCQQSGKCCVSHGQYGFVYLTKEDRKNIAAKLGMSTSEFTKKHCAKTDGVWHIVDDGKACTFLKKNQCTVYEARPMQCRTWPFWPETMSPKAWKQDVVKFCPGVGKGPLVSRDQIQAALKDQTQWEEDLVNGK